MSAARSGRWMSQSTAVAALPLLLLGLLLASGAAQVGAQRAVVTTRRCGLGHERVGFKGFLNGLAWQVLAANPVAALSAHPPPHPAAPYTCRRAEQTYGTSLRKMGCWVPISLRVCQPQLRAASFLSVARIHTFSRRSGVAEATLLRRRRISMQ